MRASRFSTIVKFATLPTKSRPIVSRNVTFKWQSGTCKSFDLIGRSDRVPSFLTKVAEKMRLERCSASDVNVRENVTKTKYGLDPRDPRIREALEPLIQFDQVLYDKVASSESVAESV